MKQVYLFLLIIFCVHVQCIQSFAQGRRSKESDKVSVFIPPQYEILDAVSDDMNEDGFTDYALVLRNENEDEDGDELRPLLLIMGSKNGQLSLLARNDSVVLCKSCGGVFGDPFQRIVFKNKLLLIEHNVGMNWRWSRNISFRYDAALADFVLYNDVALSYQQFNSNRQTASEPKKEDENKQFFKSYSFGKNR